MRRQRRLSWPYNRNGRAVAPMQKMDPQVVNLEIVEALYHLPSYLLAKVLISIAYHWKTLQMMKLQPTNSMLVTAQSRFRQIAIPVIVTLKMVLKGQQKILLNIRGQTRPAFKLQLSSKKHTNVPQRSRHNGATALNGSIVSSAEESTNSKSSTSALTSIG